MVARWGERADELIIGRTDKLGIGRTPVRGRCNAARYNVEVNLAFAQATVKFHVLVP